MTYNPHTRLSFCDVCENTPIDSALFAYHKTSTGTPYGPACHLCQSCIDVGAFFCITCQFIHAQGESCGQLTFLNEPKEEKPDQIEQL